MKIAFRHAFVAALCALCPAVAWAQSSEGDSNSYYLTDAVEQPQSSPSDAPVAPVQGPVTITSGFGQRQDPLESWLSAFHYGIDISAWYGTPVYATREGKVVFAGWEGNLGWTVEIQHEMGFKTLYGHNRAELAVRTGDMVKAGQRIAYASDTGRATGPHVHYEIILNGKSLDPMKFLELPGGSRVQSQ